MHTPCVQVHLPLLRDLGHAEYRAALKHMEVCHWTAGDVVLEQGARSEALYLLVAGSLPVSYTHLTLPTNLRV